MAVKEQKITDHYAIYNGDVNEVLPDLKENSIHFSIYSPPFGGLYHYSSDERDLSNCYDYDEFFNHYDYLIEQLYRVTLPGRSTAVHCTDIPNGNSGKDSQIDFPGDIITQHVRCRDDNCKGSFFERLTGKCGHGWFYFTARHTIWKEPLWVRNRTMTKNLSHSTIVNDSAYGGVASADYLLVFRKRGENQIPIAHPTGFDHYVGGCPMPKDVLKYKNFIGDQKQNRYSHWIWRRYASSIWDDIRGCLGENDDKDFESVLPFTPSNDGSDQEEKHVHPLQLDVYDRAIIMRSNPGEVVLEPFGGIGSGAYSAIRNGRKTISVELKTAYYNQMVKNADNAVKNPRTNEQITMEL